MYHIRLKLQREEKAISKWRHTIRPVSPTQEGIIELTFGDGRVDQRLRVFICNLSTLWIMSSSTSDHGSLHTETQPPPSGCLSWFLCFQEHLLQLRFPVVPREAATCLLFPVCLPVVVFHSRRNNSAAYFHWSVANGFPSDGVSTASTCTGGGSVNNQQEKMSQ